MENLNNIETYAKLIIGLTGAIATLSKIKENFASLKRKQELKLELEILEKIKDKKEFETIEIEKKINEKLRKTFEDNSENLTNFFIGIVVFVGFAFWSVDIIKNSVNFDGWVILTSLFSLIGLLMVLGGDKSDNKLEKGLFYQIGFYDKTNFVTGFIVTLLTGILTPLLILKSNEFSFWQFVSGLFFIIGIASLIKNTKQIK